MEKTKRNILLITNQKSYWKPYSDHLTFLGFEVDFCTSFGEIKKICKEKEYFCAILNAYDPCSLLGYSAFAKTYFNKYGNASMGTMIVGELLCELKIPFLSFALLPEDLENVDREKLSSELVWMGVMGAVATPKEDIFQKLWNISDKKELKTEFSKLQ